MAQGFHDDTSEVRPLKTVRECRDSDGFLTLDRRETNDPMRLFPQIIDTLNHSFSNYQQTYLSGHRELLFTAIPDLRFHDLRHSYAVLSLQSGCDIKTVQENLGHYAAAFTLDTYGHVTEQMRRDGAEKINNFIESMEKKMG